MTYDPTKPFKAQILKEIKKTWGGRVVDCGPYSMIKLKNGDMGLFHADGIGTKGLLHWQQRTFEAAAQDALAMNVDDMIMLGIYPEVAIDHLMLQEDDNEAIHSFMKGLCKLCSKYGIIVPGGETAIIDTLQGIEASIVTFGAAEKDCLLKPDVKPDDRIIGIKSSGIHSNGMTFVRELFFDKLGLKVESKAPYDKKTTVGKELTIPTEIYLNSLNDVLCNYENDVSSMMHITGGAFTKLLDISGNNEMWVLGEKMPPQKLFKFIYQQGVSDVDMHKKFNCGVGYVVTCRPGAENDILDILNEKHDAAVIGYVRKADSPQVVVHSAFSNKLIRYNKDKKGKVTGEIVHLTL